MRGTSWWLSVIVVAAATLAVAFCCVMVGSVHVAPGLLVKALLGGGDPVLSAILWEIRLPRVLLGLVVGGGLAMCGVVLQGITGNILVGPYTLGISAGSALGAVLGMVTGSGIIMPQVGALFGALAVLWLVYLMASVRGFSSEGIILCGVIVSFFCSSMILFVFSLSSSHQISSAVSWLVGDLSRGGWSDVLWNVVAAACCGVLMMLTGRDVDILALGDEKAISLGVKPVTVRKVVFVLASVLTAICIASSGMIGFVGLMVPHAARRLAGCNVTRRLLPLSFLLGGAFLALCDALSRGAFMVTDTELPVGVITGVAGSIFFLVIFFKRGTDDGVIA